MKLSDMLQVGSVVEFELGRFVHEPCQKATYIVVAGPFEYHGSTVFGILMLTSGLPTGFAHWYPDSNDTMEIVAL